MLAHAHQRERRPRRHVEAAEQFLPARLAGEVEFGGRGIRSGAAVAGDRGVEAGAVRPEGFGKRLEEGDALARLHARIAVEDVGGERDARRLAPTGEKLLAPLHQRCRLGGARRAGVAIEERAAAIRDGGEKIAEEGRIRIHRRTPQALMPDIAIHMGRRPRPDGNPVRERRGLLFWVIRRRTAGSAAILVFKYGIRPIPWLMSSIQRHLHLLSIIMYARFSLLH